MMSVPPNTARTIYKYLISDKSRHGQVRYYVRVPGSRKIRIRGELGSKRFEEQWRAALSGKLPALSRREEVLRRYIDGDLTKAVAQAKSRAAAKSVPYSLDMESMLERLRAQDYKCALTRRDFEPRQTGNYPNNRNPWSASIDRIEPAAGYVPENVRIIGLGVNTALSNWGDEFLREMADKYLKNAPDQAVPFRV